MSAASSFKEFVNKPEGKVALGAAGAFVLWSWYKGKGGNPLTAAQASAASTATTSPDGTVVLPSFTSSPGTGSIDGSHDGGGVAQGGSFTGSQGSNPPATNPPAATGAPIIAQGPVATAPTTPSTPAYQPKYVTVAPWPAVTSTLWGIATTNGLTVTQLLALPGNSQYRANPSLVYAGQQVQVS